MSSIFYRSLLKFFRREQVSDILKMRKDTRKRYSWLKLYKKEVYCF